MFPPATKNAVAGHMRPAGRYLPTPAVRQTLQAICWHLQTSIERNTHELWVVTLSNTFAKLKG